MPDAPGGLSVGGLGTVVWVTRPAYADESAKESRNEELTARHQAPKPFFFALAKPRRSRQFAVDAKKASRSPPLAFKFVIAAPGSGHRSPPKWGLVVSRRARLGHRTFDPPLECP
jgi:hypothetical protein